MYFGQLLQPLATYVFEEEQHALNQPTRRSVPVTSLPADSQVSKLTIQSSCVQKPVLQSTDDDSCGADYFSGGLGLQSDCHQMTASQEKAQIFI